MNAECPDLIAHPSDDGAMGPQPVCQVGGLERHDDFHRPPGERDRSRPTFPAEDVRPEPR